MHKNNGPDISMAGLDDNRTLRDACVDDYYSLVLPTIQRLRLVFDDPNKNEREQDIMAMKNRLLNHAHSVGPALQRSNPTYLEKTELAENIGRYVIMLAASNSLDANIFLQPSPISASLGEIVDGIESLTGNKLSTNMSLQLTRTEFGVERTFTFIPTSGNAKKKLIGSLDDSSWPMSPVDSLCLLICKIWPTSSDIEYNCPYTTRYSADDLWNDHIMKWWLELAEPIRKLLMAIYTNMSERFDNIPPVNEDLDTCKVPLETVKFIVELEYEFSRKEIVESIWSDLDPSICDQIFNIYHQNAATFNEMIRREYHTVYDDSSNLERTAKILLDIFLEVPRD
jgi:hypothetical protein